MCIIIYKPADKKIEKSVLEGCFEVHGDGAGFMFNDPETQQLNVLKGFFTFKDFWNAYQSFEDFQCVIHFRWATHGVKDIANCHPFYVNENLAFAHNGVIHDVKEWDKNFSDTWHFNQAILKNLIREAPEIWKSKQLRFLVERFIGGGNKLVFLNNRGEYRIYNEQAGVWDDGCWYSNETYQWGIWAMMHDFGVGAPKEFCCEPEKPSALYIPSSTDVDEVVQALRDAVNDPEAGKDMDELAFGPTP